MIDVWGSWGDPNAHPETDPTQEAVHGTLRSTLLDVSPSHARLPIEAEPDGSLKGRDSFRDCVG